MITTKNVEDNVVLLTDFYKFGHPEQYPKDTQYVYANWTPRASRVADTDGVVFAGLQYFIQKYLDTWSTQFFWRSKQIVIQEYKEFIGKTLGNTNPKTDHIEKLWDLGYLPLKIYALPEGTVTPIGVPMFVIVNTHPSAYWLPNFFETLLSQTIWGMCTSATTARRFRKLFIEKAKQAGETNFDFVNYQGHDFSERGMFGLEASIISGMGHLLSFNGTDTAPALLAAEEYYGHKIELASVPATEHSVMCAGSQEGELDTFKRLITEIYPKGLVSIVSDTWDLWKVLTNYVPKLKHEIINRDGRTVFRPDSGNPVDIICGTKVNCEMYTDSCPAATNEELGALRLLHKALGTEPPTGALKRIAKAGLIYGDGINLDNANEILTKAIKLGFSPYNIVLGIGSFTYQYVTRDTYGFAMKSTAVVRGGNLVNIFKNPITDTGNLKKSLVGIPCVYRDGSGKLVVLDGCKPHQLDDCEFQKVYENGKLLVYQTFNEIRNRVRESI